jgi:hypothetical protein
MPSRPSLLALLACVTLSTCARPTTAVAPTPSVPFVADPPAAAVPVATTDGGAAALDATAVETPVIEDAAVVRRGACFVRRALVYPCHGAPLTEAPRPMRVELCDGCRDDADCRAARAGRCVMVSGNTCSQPLRACRYPGDACARCEGRPSFDADGCVNDGAGHAVCARLGPPPPAAPHR